MNKKKIIEKTKNKIDFSESFSLEFARSERLRKIRATIRDNEKSLKEFQGKSGFFIFFFASERVIANSDAVSSHRLASSIDTFIVVFTRASI